MNREPIRNRAVNVFAARQIHYRPPLTRVFAKAVSYLAAYIDNNVCCEHQISSGNLSHDSPFDQKNSVV